MKKKETKTKNVPSPMTISRRTEADNTHREIYTMLLYNERKKEKDRENSILQFAKIYIYVPW